jgi:hypothetical protein
MRRPALSYPVQRRVTLLRRQGAAPLCHDGLGGDALDADLRDAAFLAQDDVMPKIRSRFCCRRKRRIEFDSNST